MPALTTTDARAWTLVHTARSSIVDQILPALGQPILGDPTPAADVAPERIAAARLELVDACHLLFDALQVLDGEAGR
jgi:hypothetical protein